MCQELIDQDTFTRVLSSLKNFSVCIDFNTYKTFYVPPVIFDNFTFIRCGNLYEFRNIDDDDYDYSINNQKFISIKYMAAVPQMSGLILRVDFYGGDHIIIKQQSGYEEMP